jgi:D-alanyl-D-alanine carboxypeptidase
MRNFLFKFLVSLFIVTNLFVNISSINAFAITAVPPLYAEGVILIDGITGKVLYEKNSNIQYEPASTTKVMTAILAIENSNLDDKVTIGEKPPYADGSSLGIQKGEVYTMKELLYGLLLGSCNDCAEAIAEYISGSNAAFGELMTKKAREIGANDTVFKNPSGLSEKGHLTTAHDLALILQYALKLDAYVEISRTEYYKFEDHPYSDGTEKWAVNGNNCLGQDSQYYYENLYAGKIGYTPEANHTYVAAARKNDQLLIAAFLNAEDKVAHYSSVGPFFDWGFENFKTEKIVAEGEKLAEYNLSNNVIVPLLSTKDIYRTRAIDDNSAIEKSVEYENKDFSTTSIKEGDILFNGSLIINGQKFTDIELASGIDREYTTEVKIEQTIDKIISNKLFIPGIIGLIILIFLVISIIIRRIRYNKRRNFIRRRHNF